VVHWPGGTASNDGRQQTRNIDHQWRGSAVIPYNYLIGRTPGGQWEVIEGCGRDIRGIHSPP
jgi:hypothetical protein